MRPADAQITDVARDPNWLAHRFDPTHDAVHFIHVPRETHRKLTFLTDEYLPAGLAPVILSRQDAIDAAGAPAPVHFIFHSAFCCSTLLARAFDVEGVSMGLKEPVILNDIVGWRHRGADPRGVARALDHALALLARPFDEHEAVILKPSNVVNGLAPAMLKLRGDAKALLLFAPLRTFLSSIAKKGMWGRLWVRDLLVKQLKEGLVDLGFASDEYLALTDLQAAAAGWLAQQALFGRIVAELGPGRARTLDSETLLARPAETVSALAGLFGLGLTSNAIDAIVSGPAFRSHSKFGTDFGPDQRAREYRDAAEVHGDEIDKVAQWAEAVATSAGVSMTLDAALLS